MFVEIAISTKLFSSEPILKYYTDGFFKIKHTENGEIFVYINLQRKTKVQAPLKAVEARTVTTSVSDLDPH